MTAPLQTDADLEHRREEIRRGLTRANTAAGFILVTVIVLAIVAVAQYWRAETAAREAEAAHDQAENELWKSQITQARAARLSDVSGRRSESLQAITAAAKRQATLELRNEAIASLALPDVTESAARRSFSSNANLIVSDASAKHFAVAGAGRIQVFGGTNAPPQLTLDNHGSRALFMTFSPDARFLAVRFDDGRRCVWNVGATNLLIEQHPPPGSPVETMAFSPDGRLFVNGLPDGRVQFFDLPSGERRESLETGVSPRWLTFSPDSGTLVMTSGRLLTMFDWRSQREIRRIEHANNLGAVCWHPDGSQLAVGTDKGEILFYNLTSEFDDESAREILTGHSDRLRWLRFNHRGDLLASATADGDLRFWDGFSGRFLLGGTEGQPLAFSADDRYLACRRDASSVAMLEVSAGEVFRALALGPTRDRGVVSLAFSADDRFLLGANGDELFWWDLERDTPHGRVRAPRCRTVCFAENGKSLLALGGEGMLRFPVSINQGGFALGEPNRLYSQPMGNASRVAGQPEKLVALRRGGASIVNLARSSEMQSFDWLPGASAIALAPDGRWLATGGPKIGTVLWNVNERRDVSRLDQDGGTLAFSPDGRWLLVGTSAKYSFWDTTSWKAYQPTITRFAGETIAGPAAFSPDGKLAAICQQRRRVQLVEVPSGSQIATLESPHAGAVLTLAFSHDGQSLAVGTDDREAQVWNLRALRENLSTMRLNWQEASPAVFQTPFTSSLVRRGGLAQYWPALLPLLGILVALGFGLSILRHQRGLVRSYGEVENLVARRNAQLAQAEVELIQSQKMEALGTLAAGIAHDFNNLLSVISLSNDLVHRESKDRATVTEETAAIQDAVQQGRQIVESMLGYSRARSETPVDFAVGELVADTVALLSKQFLQGIRLTLDDQSNHAVVRASRGRVQQILLNLIVNASEAMHGTGRLSIRVRELAEVPGTVILAPAAAVRYVELVVADSGPGIALDVLPRIFEPFFTTKTLGTAKGTGLGLSTVHTIARMEGFGLAVQTAPSQGAAFTVFIPAGQL